MRGAYSPRREVTCLLPERMGGGAEGVGGQGREDRRGAERRVTGGSGSGEFTAVSLQSGLSPPLKASRPALAARKALRFASPGGDP
jgi:hypothetical protein